MPIRKNKTAQDDQIFFFARFMVFLMISYLTDLFDFWIVYFIINMSCVLQFALFNLRYLLFAAVCEYVFFSRISWNRSILQELYRDSMHVIMFLLV